MTAMPPPGAWDEVAGIATFSSIAQMPFKLFSIAGIGGQAVTKGALSGSVAQLSVDRLGGRCRVGACLEHPTALRQVLMAREQILHVHAKRLVLGPDVDLAGVAAKTAGLAGADLANIVNEAALRAARDNKSAVEMKDFDEAIDRAIAGLEKKRRVMTAKGRETVAHHEASHALIAEFRPTADKVAKVSIIPRGIGALGYTQQQPTEDRYLLKHGELLDRLDVLLGGRAAEQLVFKELSTGAQNDLQRATAIARQMVTLYGMSDVLGPATFEPSPAPLFLPEGAALRRSEYSERTAEAIDEEVRGLLLASAERVRKTLTAHRTELLALAHELLQHEVVDRKTLTNILQVRPWKHRLPLNFNHTSRDACTGRRRSRGFRAAVRAGRGVFWSSAV